MNINITFLLLCSLVICTPLLRGGVHLWTTTIIQIVSLSCLFIFLIQRLSETKKTPLKAPLIGPLAALSLLVLTTSVLSNYPSLAREGSIMFFCYVTVFYIGVNSVKTRKEQRLLVYIIIGTTLLISVIAVLKQLNINPFHFWDYTDLPYKGLYLAGTYGNHNHFAGLLAMTIPMALCLFFTKKRSPQKKIFLLIIVIILLTTLTFTFSRGGWFATLFALFFFAAIILQTRTYNTLYSARTIVFILIGFILILISSPVYQRIISLFHENGSDHGQFRLQVWESTIALINDYPYTGTGPGTFAQSFPRFNPAGFDILPVYAHNDYLQFTAETGLLFIPLVLWLIYAFFKNGFVKLTSKSRQMRGITIGAMTSVFAILVHSLFDFNLHIPANALLFTLLAALVCSDPPSSLHKDSCRLHK